jgi:hypothetical protein
MLKPLLPAGILSLRGQDRGLEHYAQPWPRG